MKKSIILLVLAETLLLAGCSESNIPNSGSVFSELSDPMDASDISDENSKTPQHKSHSYGFVFREDNISAVNGRLILTPVLKGAKETTTVGFLVFIDGVMQRYSANGSLISYMSQFDTIPNGEEMITLEVDAVLDANLNEHNIGIVGILCPDFRPNPEQRSFGFYHNILQSAQYKLAADGANFAATEYISARAENSVMTKTQKDKYSQGDSDGEPIYNAFELSQNGSSGTEYFLNNGETSLKLNFVSCTSSPYVIEQRVTVYKNHEPCKINGELDFIEITSEGGKITETEITINDVKTGDIIYCIASQLGNEITAAVNKSKSRIVIDETGEFSQNYTNVSQNESQKVTVEKSSPLFSIGETAFFINSENYSNSDGSGILLCRSADGINIDKMLEIGSAKIKKHDEKITFIGESDGHICARIFDDNLTEKSCVIIDELAGDFHEPGQELAIDFDGETLVFTDDLGKLCSCDSESKNEKTLMSLPCAEAPDALEFTDIYLFDNYIAFTASGGKKDFYGVCDLNGNYEIAAKKGSRLLGANNGIAVWGDGHVALDALPSGKVEIFKNGEFGTLKTVEQAESQYAFLSGDSILTFNGECDILRRYCGENVTEYPLPEGEYGVSAMICGDKIFVESFGADNITHTYSMNLK